MHLIYTAALGLGLLVTLPYYAVRFRKYLPTLRERLGFVPRIDGERPIWIHAVSVGELRAVDPLIRQLRERTDGRPLVVSTTTPTGRKLALERSDVDQVVYFPLDLPFAVRRALARLRPERVIIAETEIWPNFLRECAASDIPVYMLNGRISDRSFPRYRWARRWLAHSLEGYTLLGMQSETDAARIRQLGAPGQKVVVFGNLKYDASRPEAPMDPVLAQALRSPPLLIAASTSEGEEVHVIDAYRRLLATHGELKLLLAPRRAERFDDVARLLDASGLKWRRRTCLGPGESPDEVLLGEVLLGEVLLLDTIGELNALFGFASVVFMGGTLVPTGGHNILEAVRYGKPVVFGPHMDNFRDMAREFLEAGAAIEVSDSAQLAREVGRLLEDTAARESMVDAGLRLLEKNRGATSLALAAIFQSPDGEARDASPAAAIP